MLFGDKTLREMIGDEVISAEFTDILQNAKFVRNHMGSTNNEQFMLPLMVMLNSQILKELKEIRKELSSNKETIEKVKEDVLNIPKKK